MGTLRVAGVSLENRRARRGPEEAGRLHLRWSVGAGLNPMPFNLRRDVARLFRLVVLCCALSLGQGAPRGSDYGSGKGTAGSNSFIGKSRPLFSPAPHLQQTAAGHVE